MVSIFEGRIWSCYIFKLVLSSSLGLWARSVNSGCLPVRLSFHRSLWHHGNWPQYRLLPLKTRSIFRGMSVSYFNRSGFELATARPTCSETLLLLFLSSPPPPPAPINGVAITSPESCYCPTSREPCDLIVIKTCEHVSTCTSYNSNALTTVVLKLWRW